MAGGGGGKEEEEGSPRGTSGGSPKDTAPSSTSKGPVPNVIELLKGEGSPEDLTRVLLTEIERGLCALPTAVCLTPFPPPTAARTKKESAE